MNLSILNIFYLSICLSFMLIFNYIYPFSTTAKMFKDLKVKIEWIIIPTHLDHLHMSILHGLLKDCYHLILPFLLLILLLSGLHHLLLELFLNNHLPYILILLHIDHFILHPNILHNFLILLHLLLLLLIHLIIIK